MPKRDSHDEAAAAAVAAVGLLRPPSSARSRPPSAAGTAAARPVSNPYLGHIPHASTSTSSLNALSNQQAQSFAYGGVGTGLTLQHGTSPNANDAPTAPFLATAEMHLGRMTLTAPDNMRRRKAEEKEKRRKARRVNAAATGERGDVYGDVVRTSSPSVPVASGTTAANTGTDSSRTRRQRPGMPKTRSSSNLQLTYTIEPQRSRSPTRPPTRPRSAQNATRTETSPERRPAANNAPADQRRVQRTIKPRRTNSGSSARHAAVSSEETQPQVAGPSQTSGRQGRTTTANESRNAVRAEALRRATRRRRDIYADLSSLGLPGASESESEDTPPPPFPLNATRPISPPAQPSEGQEWTEEMRRRQEEYINNLPPESPPPAFLSEEEGEQARAASVRGPAQAQSEQPTAHTADSTLSSDDDSIDQPMSEARRLWEEDAAAGHTLEERIRREQARREASSADHSAVVLANSNLGQLVTEARARRRPQRTISAEEVPVIPIVAEPSPPVNTRTGNEASRKTNKAFLSPHRRAHSDSHSRESAAPQSGEAARSSNELSHRHKVNAAVGTGKGLLSEDTSREMMTARGKITKIRPRPASESHSRFRDDATAAANRRLALWGPPSLGASGSSGSAPSAPSPSFFELVAPARSQATNAREASRLEQNAVRPERLERKNTSSSSGGGADDEGLESSDSETEWQKEENAFQEMQRKSAANEIAVESSDEEQGSHSPRRRFSEELPELGRLGRTVPRAPPPLVLGRSRGGAAYSSSSESSSESDGQRLREDDDASSEQDEASEHIHEHDDESAVSTSSVNESRTKLDKGKQPMRPQLPPRPPSKEEPLLLLSDSDGNGFADRAGTFVEDSSSSHEFTDDEEAYVDAQSTVRVPPSTHQQMPHQDQLDPRAPVQNRLKGLFARQLSSPDQHVYPTASNKNASRVSLEKLFDTPLGTISDADVRSKALSTSSRRASSSRQTDAPENLRPTSPPSSLAPRQDGRTLASAPRALTEEQARSEALRSISQIQRSQDHLPQGVDGDSLLALERLLVRSNYSHLTPTTQVSSNSAQPLMNEPSKLTRSGAVSNRRTSTDNDGDGIGMQGEGTFVNPRTVNAPRPLGRLPTITAATRHFPPSQRPSQARESDVQPSRRMRPPSTIGTPSWMAYIPASERASLPAPMQPDRRVHDGHMEVPTNRSPSPSASSLASRNRVSAMIERFEERPMRENLPQTSRPVSPPKRSDAVLSAFATGPSQYGRPNMPSSGGSTQRSDVQMHTFRRRPPPPPPPVALRDPGVASIMPAGLESSRPEGTSGMTVQPDEQPALALGIPTLPVRPSYDAVRHGTIFDRQETVPRQVAERPLAPLPSSGSNGTIPIFGTPYTAEDRSRSSATLFSNTSRPLPVPPTMQDRPVRPLQQPPVSRPVQQPVTALIANASSEEIMTTPPRIEQSDNFESEAAPVNPRSSISVDEPVAITDTDNRSTTPNLPRRAPSLGITDLDLFASRLADARSQRQDGGQGDGQADSQAADENDDAPENDSNDQYDDLHLLAEFLGPAKAPGLTPQEMETLPVGRVEVLRRRIVGKREDGRDKVKLALAVAGVKVERCAVCLVQFREGNLACVFPCLHVLHEQCASKLLRNTKLCPTCRLPVVEST